MKVRTRVRMTTLCVDRWSALSMRHPTHGHDAGDPLRLYPHGYTRAHE
jgi:hypothetical protein